MGAGIAGNLGREVRSHPGRHGGGKNIIDRRPDISKLPDDGFR
jgi:hypothetical protein